MSSISAAKAWSVEPIIGQGIEPILYGRSMGLSAVAVVVAAGFWTWLWGPVGLLLSTPLTMCFVVFSRHIESLKFLDVMLGNQPALPTPNCHRSRCADGGGIIRRCLYPSK